jgi:hypothetical protein
MCVCVLHVIEFFEILALMSGVGHAFRVCAVRILWVKAAALLGLLHLLRVPTIVLKYYPLSRFSLIFVSVNYVHCPLLLHKMPLGRCGCS